MPNLTVASKYGTPMNEERFRQEEKLGRLKSRSTECRLSKNNSIVEEIVDIKLA